MTYVWYNDWTGRKHRTRTCDGVEVAPNHGCQLCCDKCNYDRHECDLCGQPIGHGQYTCEECDDE
ncbi:MAG TPA: hypothetical protein VLT90_12970 [Terriglobales bacterium]|nr:hypothetical protein [Terriglobales bacterium]